MSLAGGSKFGRICLLRFEHCQRASGLAMGFGLYFESEYLIYVSIFDLADLELKYSLTYLNQVEFKILLDVTSELSFPGYNV